MKKLNFLLCLGLIVSQFSLLEAAEVGVEESCIYSVSLDKSSVNFGDVSSPTVRYVTLTNDSIVNGNRDCSIRINQIALTHKNQGYGTEAFKFEVLGTALDDKMLAVNESAEIKITMTPDYNDGIVKYFVPVLWIQALGYNDDGSKEWVRRTSRLIANEIPEELAQEHCQYSLSYDKKLYDFGALQAGDTLDKDVYLENTGTCPLLVLHQAIYGPENFSYRISKKNRKRFTRYKRLLAGERLHYILSFSPLKYRKFETYNNSIIYARAKRMNIDKYRGGCGIYINAISKLNGKFFFQPYE